MKDIKDLQTDWQNATVPNHSSAELAMMTAVKNHAQLRGIRIKLIIESVLLIAFLSTYYNALDGDRRPLWLNAVFITSALLYIASDLAGFINITRLTRGVNILDALKSLEARLQKIKTFSLCTSFTFGLSLIALMSSGIVLTPVKLWTIAGLIAIQLGFVYIAYRDWNRRIGQVAETIAGFTPSRPSLERSERSH